MPIYDHTWLIAEWKRMGRPDIEVLLNKNDHWDFADIESCGFSEYLQYRIKSKPWINWEYVHKDFIAMASDSSGECYLYAHKPPRLDDSFYSWKRMEQRLDCASAERFASFALGTCDWKDSLVMRPVVKQ